MHINTLKEIDDFIISIIIFYFRLPWRYKKHGTLLKRFHFVPHVFHVRVNNNWTERGMLLMIFVIYIQSTQCIQFVIDYVGILP